jgi:very-short-patch-repair endonuclease
LREAAVIRILECSPGSRFMRELLTMAPGQVRNATDPKVLSMTHKLITYVRDIVRSRHRPIRDVASYALTVWLADLPDEAYPIPQSDDLLFTLEYLPHRAHPKVPSALRGWVNEESLTDPNSGSPELAAEGPINTRTSEDCVSPQSAMIVPRSQAPELLHIYEEWLPTWQIWAREEVAAQHHRDLYRRLSEMSARVTQADDVYEVVLAAGLIRRDGSSARRLTRHLIAKRISIIIDRDTAKITVMLANDAAARFEDREFLGQDDGYQIDRAEHPRTELSDRDAHPLAEDTWLLLQRWVELAFDEPVRSDRGWDRPDFSSDTISLTLAPAILLRRRDTGSLADYYDHIAASLSGPGARSPLGLAQLVTPLEREERLKWDDGYAPGRRTGSLPPDALFPLPANDAQRDVLERMHSDTAVVVQGPPGTGKTHTIANLICAFLAQGRRVLVTSQKDQALRELRDKLPSPVRDLCVMLTGIQREGPDEFERSITALSNKISSSNPATLDRQIQELTDQRKSLLAQQAELREAIQELRQAESVVHPEVAAGYGGTLSNIASRVKARTPDYDWLPPFPGRPTGRNPEEGQLPVDADELLELLSLLRQETPTRLARRNEQLPDPDVIPLPESFRRLVSAAQEAEALIANAGETVRALASIGDEGLSEMARQVETAADHVHCMGLPSQTAHWDTGDWRTRALKDRFKHRNLQLWYDIAMTWKETKKVQKSLSTLGLRQVMLPQLSDDKVAAMIAVGTNLGDYLADGGRIRRCLPSRAQRDARELLDSCRVDGRPIADVSDLDAVLRWLRAKISAAAFAKMWGLAGITITTEPDLRVVLAQIADLHEHLSRIYAIGNVRDTIDKSLIKRGIRLAELSTAAGWDNLCGSITTAQALRRIQRNQEQLNEISNLMPDPALSDPQELTDLRQAVRSKDVTGYQMAFCALEEARREQCAQRRCDELLDRLRNVHSEFADVLTETASEAGWPERLRAWPEAWAWRTAREFCGKMLKPGREHELQQRLNEAQSQASVTTERLAAAHAWLNCLNRITQQQQQAIQAYRSAIAGLGKGTGRYAALHRRAARSAMREAQGAVPAWIMPLPKVIETVSPAQNAFDVVIVDEASQAGLDALFLLWLAPRVIVVGDDKQCAPIFAAEHQEFYNHLDSYLADLPEHVRHGFRPDNNLYELLSQSFPDVVRLTEHFRCMPEIIGWSSQQFYDGSLVPLRQFRADRLHPLKVVHLPDGYTEGRLDNIRNEPEAKKLLEKLQELLADPSYQNPPKTFGIIALQGTGQARLLETMIYQSIDPTLLARHNIRIGTPPDFQGAECDVVMLSMVVKEPYRALTRRAEQRRFNVAASRARDQMWLFTSVKRDMLKNSDLRFSLLEYMEDPPSFLGQSPAPAEVSPDEPDPRFDSLFEQRVFLEIRSRGYHVIPQFKAGDRRIDMVVSGLNSRLAVECDGTAAHSTLEQIHSDLERERELRRLGWDFWRVRQSEFSFDPESALQPLWAELGKRGIFPGTEEIIVGTTSSSWSPTELPEDETAADDEPRDGDRSYD